MAKNDRRIRYTKQMIKTSLLEMLETTPFEGITVKALCQKAEINRATFYTHYETLTALMEEVEYEECKQLFDLLDDILIEEDRLYHSTSIMLRFLKEHPAMREVFLCRTTVGNSLSRLTWERLNKTMNFMTSVGNLPPKQAYWLLSFIVYGMREILRQWFESDMENEEEFIHTLSRFIRNGLSDFIQPEAFSSKEINSYFHK